MPLRKYLPLLLFATLFFCFFYFQLFRYLSLESLTQHHALLLQWKETHYLLAVSLYILSYSLAVAAAFPAALFFTVTGGLLFGPFPGGLYVILSVTIGSVLLYRTVKRAFAERLQKKAEKWRTALAPGLQKNAFYYLLFLRLLPLFPCFLINVVSGLLAVPLPVFIGATLLGLLPSTLIYTSLGHHLGTLFQHHQHPGIALLLQPAFFLPLCALAFLALGPLAYQHFKKK